MSDIENNMSQHAKLNHVDITKYDVKIRFSKKGVKIEGGYTLDETYPSIISWWKSEKLMYLYLKIAFNDEQNKKEIQKWLKLWSKEDGYTTYFDCKTNMAIGKFAYRYSDWNLEFNASNIRIVIQVESAGGVENAGFSIKTAFPIPNEKELDIAKATVYSGKAK